MQAPKMTNISGNHLDCPGPCCVSAMKKMICHLTVEDLLHPMDVKKRQIQIKCLLPADKAVQRQGLVKLSAISYRIEERILKNIYYELSQHVTNPSVKPCPTHSLAFMR